MSLVWAGVLGWLAGLVVGVSSLGILVLVVYGRPTPGRERVLGLLGLLLWLGTCVILCVLAALYLLPR